MVCEWFGGTYDLLLKINGCLFLVDFKTSNHVTYKYYMQLAAYSYMLKQQGIYISGVIILQLAKTSPRYNEFVLDFSNQSDKYYFEEGRIHLDGSQALAYCRERQSFADGDMRRNENQQLILEAIINKLTGPTIILKYASILDAVKGTVETDMSKDEMTDLVKVVLKDIRGLDISKQAIKGYPGFAYCYALGAEASVVMPDYDSLYESIGVIEGLYEEE